MSASTFFDTNVLLYLLSGDARKADAAEALVAGGGTVSVQVLNEFAATAVRKLRMSWPETTEVLKAVRSACDVTPLTVEMHDLGCSLAMRHGFAVYDGMIVAAALVSGCDVLYSEDLQHGRRVDGRLMIKNPFR